MQRISIFKTKKEIASFLGSNYTTITAWQSGHNGAPRHVENDLKRLLARVVEELRARATGGTVTEFFDEIADALVADSPPPMTRSSPIEKRDPNELKDYLINELTGKKKRSTVIWAEVQKMGYTRGRLYQLANDLGVIRRHVRPGRGGYSLWSLPIEIRKRDKR